MNSIRLIVLATALLITNSYAGEIFIKRFDHKTIFFKDQGKRPGDCGFDNFQFHDQLCFNEGVDCIKNETPHWGNSARHFESYDGRLFKIDEQSKKVYLVYKDQLKEIGMVKEKIRVENYFVKGKTCMPISGPEYIIDIRNDFTVFDLALNDDVKLENLKTASTIKKVRQVNDLGRNTKTKFEFLTVAGEFVNGSDRYFFEAMTSSIYRGISTKEKEETYTTNKTSINGHLDTSRVGYYEFFFGKK